jgi:hypothetical protein
LFFRPQGEVRPSDFRLEEAAMPKPGTGTMLLKVRHLSLDPYMRGRMEDRKSYAAPAALGAVMPGESVATMVESHHPDYVPGDTVLAFTGWERTRIPPAIQLQSQVLVDEGDGHAAFAHSTRYSFDRVMAHVTRCEHTRQAGLQGKWMAIEFPGGEVAPGADIAAWIPLQIAW